MCSDAQAGPLFIVGCPRSGTTLLQRMLDSHPRVAIAPETHFVRRIARLHQGARGRILNEERFEALLDCVVGMREFGDMELVAAEYRERLAGRPRTAGAAFAALLALYAERRGASLVGEKTPNHVLYVPDLVAWFPRARFVHVIRDPRAVAQSWKTVPWSTGSVDGDAEVWRRYTAAGARHSRTYPGRLLSVRYEALVEAPERVLRDVCGFVGIAYSPQMLEFHIGSRGVDVRREPWKAGVLSAVTSSAAERWRDRLTAAEVARIEAVTLREMRRWGYSTQTPPLRLHAQAAVASLRRAGRVGRRRVGRGMRWILGRERPR